MHALARLECASLPTPLRPLTGRIKSLPCIRLMCSSALCQSCSYQLKTALQWLHQNGRKPSQPGANRSVEAMSSSFCHQVQTLQPLPWSTHPHSQTQVALDSQTLQLLNLRTQPVQLLHLRTQPVQQQMQAGLCNPSSVASDWCPGLPPRLATRGLCPSRGGAAGRVGSSGVCISKTQQQCSHSKTPIKTS